VESVNGQVGGREEGRQQLVAPRDAGEVEEREAVGADHLVDVHVEHAYEMEAAGHVLGVLPAALHHLAQLHPLLPVKARGDGRRINMCAEFGVLNTNEGYEGYEN